jgi:hypothetical protein
MVNKLLKFEPDLNKIDAWVQKIQNVPIFIGRETRIVVEEEEGIVKVKAEWFNSKKWEVIDEWFEGVEYEIPVIGGVCEEEKKTGLEIKHYIGKEEIKIVDVYENGKLLFSWIKKNGKDKFINYRENKEISPNQVKQKIIEILKQAGFPLF